MLVFFSPVTFLEFSYSVINFEWVYYYGIKYFLSENIKKILIYYFINEK